MLSTTCLVAVAAAGGVQAAGLPDGYGGLPAYGALPAVSQTNGKLSVFGSSYGEALYGVAGSLTTPLGHDFGLQLDGMVGSADAAAFYGIGGHAFWRDPAKGLIGLYSSYVGWNTATTAASTTVAGAFVDTTGANVGKVGIEGAAYLDRISLEGLAGYQFGTRAGFTGRAKIAFYPIDNLRFAAGVDYLNGPGAVGRLDVEWQPRSDSRLSFYASGSAASSSNWSVAGGLRVYFSHQDKSLIRRHREDDPEGFNLPDDLFTASGGSYCVPPQVLNSDGLTCWLPPPP